MPLPDASFTTKSAVHDPAPPLTTATSAPPAVWGAAKEHSAKMEMDPKLENASHAASLILGEGCIEAPLNPRPNFRVSFPRLRKYTGGSIPDSATHRPFDAGCLFDSLPIPA